MIESSRCVCVGLFALGPAIAEAVIAAAGIEQTVIRIARLRRRIEFHRAHRMRQVVDDMRLAQQLAPRALKRWPTDWSRAIR
jgi:hypothetical protein